MYEKPYTSMYDKLNYDTYGVAYIIEGVTPGNTMQLTNLDIKRKLGNIN